MFPYSQMEGEVTNKDMKQLAKKLDIERAIKTIKGQKDSEATGRSLSSHTKKNVTNFIMRKIKFQQLKVI